jgi:predicted O-methyltransferase YrrM
MNAVLEKILRSGRVKTPEGDSIALHSAVTEEQGRFLQRLVSVAGPTTSLEIGLGFGVSALFICDALQKNRDAHHIVIDPYQHGPTWGGIGLENLRRAGFADTVEFLEKPSHQALAELESEARSIDFAFIDGAHTFDYVLVDFCFVDRLLKVGGIVVFDDADYASIRKVLRYIVQNRSYRVLGSDGEPVDAASFGVSLRGRARRSLAALSAPRRYLRPEFLVPDWELGLEGRWVALRKEAEDDRHWTDHCDF